MLSEEGGNPNAGAHPLQSFGGRAPSRHENVTDGKIREGTQGLMPRKDPGPDGFAVELYKKLTALTPHTHLLNVMYETGTVPTGRRLRNKEKDPTVLTAGGRSRRYVRLAS